MCERSASAETLDNCHFCFPQMNGKEKSNEKHRIDLSGDSLTHLFHTWLQQRQIKCTFLHGERLTFQTQNVLLPALHRSHDGICWIWYVRHWFNCSKPMSLIVFCLAFVSVAFLLFVFSFSLRLQLLIMNGIHLSKKINVFNGQRIISLRLKNIGNEEWL